MTPKNKKIAILHPSFKWGGAESVCIKTIQALKDKYAVDLVVTEKDVNIEDINRFYGTHFKEQDLHITKLSPPIKGTIWNSHSVQRYYKKNKNNYCFAFSTKNEMDLGGKGIQYIHFPLLKNKKVANFTFKKKIYKKIGEIVSGYSQDRMKKNLTITNSCWTKEQIKNIYGIESQVIYPPIESDFPSKNWGERTEGFICISRISPEKNIKEAINILKKIRKEYDIHAHLVGSPGEKEYTDEIKKICHHNSDWITLELSPGRERIKTLLSKYKYGIHTTPNEHFGMVVAEMLQADTIPFTYNTGGQTEITNNSDIQFFSTQDAVEKIIRVIKDQNKQVSIKEKLDQQKNKFTVANFTNNIQKTVNNFYDKQINQ
jgi:glycosyltransferase involved in cell wall biosynthesis